MNKFVKKHIEEPTPTRQMPINLGHRKLQNEIQARRLKEKKKRAAEHSFLTIHGQPRHNAAGQKLGLKKRRAAVALILSDGKERRP